MAGIAFVVAAGIGADAHRRAGRPAAGTRPHDGLTGYSARCIYAAYTLGYSRGMSVPLTLLGLLDREPSHGYDLKRDYDTFFGRGRPLSFGQVYATLGRLSRDGKVVVGEVAPGEGPDRKRYVITDARRDRGGHLARPSRSRPSRTCRPCCSPRSCCR